MTNGAETKPVIKLVLWDLDDTLWRGTLSEGEIEVIPANLLLVMQLASRGIISSVVSKNDYGTTMTKLGELGVKDAFVMPSIDWTPKGPRIVALLQAIGLRPENTLFIDDLDQNLEEAKFCLPALHTLNARDLSQLEDRFDLRGDPTDKFQRLAYYKKNEARQSERQTFGRNEDFLRHSGIVLTLDRQVQAHKARVLDLLQRTNQLNFTKRRYGEDVLDDLIADPNIELAVISCRDRYGDSGIVGFYARDRQANRLLDFVFSCRVMNLGVEGYLYRQYLKAPELVVAEPVASAPKTADPVDWITLEEDNLVIEASSDNRLRLFYKGGCDLDRILASLRGLDIVVEVEFNGLGANGIPYHHEHSVLLRQLLDGSLTPSHGVDRTWPFLSEEVYSQRLITSRPDVVVWSLLMDYTQELYQHKTAGYRIPFGGYGNIMTPDDPMLDICRGRYPNEIPAINTFEACLQRDYRYLGQISPEQMVGNLTRVMAALPETCFVFVNGAEVASTSDLEACALERHRLMNACLDDFVAAHDRCHLLDVRRYVTRQADLTDNIRHYQPHVYAAMGLGLKRLLLEAVGYDALMATG